MEAQNDALILVVDDNRQNVKVLSNMLRDAGYKVMAAFNGKDALQLAEKRAPELVLLDIMMPEMDGYETCTRFKESDELNNIPVLFLSALSEVEDKLHGFSVGGQDYITKPFQQEEVLARIQTHLKLHRLEKEREAHIEQLEEQKERLKHLIESKDEVLRIVSHDMRNPLNGIIGLSNLMLEEEMTDEEQQELLSSIEYSGQQLLNIVNELLDAARFESDQLKLQLNEYDITDSVQRVLDLQRPNARYKNINLEAEIDDSIGTVELDQAKIEQSLGNLISNAIKFTNQGGTVNVRATIDTSNENEKELLLQVSDDGIGIPEKMQKTLFEKYGKHRREGTKGEESNGLGLPIVKQFVNAHQGSIDVESVEGEGATFIIRLPLAAEPVETLIK